MIHFLIGCYKSVSGDGKGERRNPNDKKNKLCLLDTKPARIAQLVRALDLKTQGCGFHSRAGQPNKC